MQIEVTAKCESSIERRLLAMEGGHRIDLNGAAGRQITSEQGYAKQDQGRNQKAKRIGWAYSD